MSKNLVIVESPAKSKTIEKYLGSDYKVLSSKGHIRDLATSGKYGFGVDIEDGFKPNYEPIKGKKKDIAELKKEVKNAEKVYLATDPDREGEAISWHLKDALGIDDKDYERIVFNEITKNAVVNSFKNARKIDDLMVRSQETRRILDRIIGFRLSKLMQSKTGGKSAGRVQSVALKLIVDREKEIEKFIPEEYWTIKAIFPSFDANLFGYKENTKLEIKNETFITGVNELEFVIKNMGTFGIPKENYKVDLTIARGLDYYTGTVYETFLNEYRELGSVCSGGRYENLAEYYTDKKLPGVGVSIGLTRLFYKLNELNLIKAKKKSISDVLIIPMIEDLTVPIEIASELRKSDIKTEIYLNNKKLKAKFKYADKLEIPYVVVIGEDEIEENKI